MTFIGFQLPFDALVAVLAIPAAAAIVLGIFLFRIRERFDTVDIEALEMFRGDRL